MKASELLRKSASIILTEYDQGIFGQHKLWGCCDTLSYVARKENVNGTVVAQSADDYLSLFNPQDGWLFWYGERTPENAEPRCLALLFAAEIAEADGN